MLRLSICHQPGVAEDGLPGSGCQVGPGLCSADHGGGGGVQVEGAGREAGPSVPAADGGLRGSAPRQERRPGQRGDETSLSTRQTGKIPTQSSN